MPAVPGARSKKQVLILDDDPAALEAMGAALGREFHVFLAPDIPTAKGVLDREGVDLVVLDVMLGEESGLDFLVHLRSKSDVPVLLISGFGTKEMVVAGLRARASDYLDKPFKATDLLEKAHVLIAQGPRPIHIADRVRDLVQQWYMTDWTVQSLAKELRLSVRTMRQMFRQRYHQSVMDFLEDVRVARARELLATTDLSIQRIAAEVGYHDPHYFSRVFHEHIELSPREFRSAQRREPPSEPPPA
jgi:YesN/AraC family two-component response regulator